MYKPQGATPLETVEAFRLAHPEYAHQSLGYAGRLDPMADGLLLVLVGEENKKRKQYERLTKTYMVKVLFGFATDSYDLLGLVIHQDSNPIITKLALEAVLDPTPTSYEQEYPPYSAPRVLGKPLYYWARKNRLDDITIPKKIVTIFEHAVTELSHITKESLQQNIRARIANVHGEFRQQDIRNQWDKILETHPATAFPLASITISCSTGTYMRAFARELGQKLRIPALAYAITRTRIGDFHLTDAIHI